MNSNSNNTRQASRCETPSSYLANALNLIGNGGGSLDGLNGLEDLLQPNNLNVASVAAAVLAQQQQQQQQQQRPEKDLTGLNILLLYADDWTHHTLSSFHNTKPRNAILQTPVLDALASDGVRFTHNCVTTSVCWISRATLYTGQYASRHNTTKPCCWGGMDKPPSKLNEAPRDWKELSFYELLADAGYHVGHSGKWGIYLPFDKSVHYNVEEDGWHYRKIGNKLWHITEKNEADALRFLVSRPRDRPFFLNAAFYATHAKDSDVRQYMPQTTSMGWYANDTIPIPDTATEEAWERMPYFFGENNEGRVRWRSRFNNATKHQIMMKNYYRMGEWIVIVVLAVCPNAHAERQTYISLLTILIFIRPMII